MQERFIDTDTDTDTDTDPEAPFRQLKDFSKQRTFVVATQKSQSLETGVIAGLSAVTCRCSDW